MVSKGHSVFLREVEGGVGVRGRDGFPQGVLNSWCEDNRSLVDIFQLKGLYHADPVVERNHMCLNTGTARGRPIFCRLNLLDENPL